MLLPLLVKVCQLTSQWPIWNRRKALIVIFIVIIQSENIRKSDKFSLLLLQLSPLSSMTNNLDGSVAPTRIYQTCITKLLFILVPLWRVALTPTLRAQVLTRAVKYSMWRQNSNITWPHTDDYIKVVKSSKTDRKQSLGLWIYYSNFKYVFSFPWHQEKHVRFKCQTSAAESFQKTMLKPVWEQHQERDVISWSLMT